MDITITPQRTFGTINVDCTLEENHVDQVAITDHPVEIGANVSDHAYVLPQEVTIRAGWSNSSAAASDDEGYIGSVYEQLLALQQSRTPFDIQTGKRAYTSMLCRSLAVKTDMTTEAVLAVTAICRQVILVATQVTQTATPAANQANPAQTAGVANGGAKTLLPVTTQVPAPVG